MSFFQIEFVLDHLHYIVANQDRNDVLE